MRMLLLAANDADADAWITRFVATSPNRRTHRIDAEHAMITVVTPADDTAARIDPADQRWRRALPIKVLRTDAWLFDPRVLAALAALGRRHPILDPTGLLGPSPEHLERKHGWTANDQRDKARPRVSRSVKGA
jgi:hypothetical protein